MFCLSLVQSRLPFLYLDISPNKKIISYTTGATNGTGTLYPLNSCVVRFNQSVVFYVVFCVSLLIFLSFCIVCPLIYWLIQTEISLIRLMFDRNGILLL
jgi:hypothetical protein